MTYLAVILMKNRLLTAFPGDFPDRVLIDGEPADEAAALALAERDKHQFQFWPIAKLGGTSRGGENKKGAVRGIDGVVGFNDFDPSKPSKEAVSVRRIIISVKGGATGPAHVRDLIGTVEREKAAIGVLVTAHQPTSSMLKDAVEVGTYTDGWGKSYPKIQIITAAEIVNGKRIGMPDQRGVAQYQAAQSAKRGVQGKLGQ